MGTQIVNRSDTEAIIREQVVQTIFQDAPKNVERYTIFSRSFNIKIPLTITTSGY